MDSHWLNAERIRVYSWMVVAIFGAAAAIWTGLSLPHGIDPRGKPIGYDFITFWSAARLALDGHPAAAFDWNSIADMQRQAVPALEGKVFLWHYPATFLLMVLPLGLLPYLVAFGAFLAATTALWAALVRRLLPSRRSWIIAAALPAGIVNLMHGQNGFLTAALAGFALLFLDRRPLMAGVLIGLLAIKPHLAVLFPIALVAEGRWRSFAAAAVTAVAFATLSFGVFGIGTLHAFLDDLSQVRRLVDASLLPWGKMPSAYVFALSLGVPSAIAMALQAFTSCVAAATVWLAWRARHAPFEAKAATLATASLLISPYIFSYDLTWSGLAMVWLAMLGLRSGFRSGEREVLLVVWIVPFAMLPILSLTGVQIGFPALLMLLTIATRRALLPETISRRKPQAVFSPTPDTATATQMRTAR